jgi:hypothetical protein
LKDIRATLGGLIDAWCERRALKPLRFLLPAYFSPLAHTDQLFELLEAIKDVKGLCRAELTQDELARTIEVHNIVEDALKSRGT